MKINKLWERYKFPRCEKCKKECQGHLNYDNLCSNLNYLEEYGERNYEKNKASFEELKQVIGNINPTIFSFGCGLGLDYIGAVEVFGDKIKYNGIDECKWAITKTEDYKNFTPKLPKTIDYNTGIFLLNGSYDNLVICFFNSLFTISESSNLDKDLFDAVKNKDKFYLLCDYTINSNFHMPSQEQNFLDKFSKRLKQYFTINQLEILDGKGIIIVAKRK